ncbi:MAG: hypothetical protein JXB07_11570, partial [Anaerolineae bacterium]|nr:hypothetical protein [Anaerolineae bacterium]
AQRNPDPIGVRGNRWGEMHTFVFISGNSPANPITYAALYGCILRELPPPRYIVVTRHLPGLMVC